MALAAAPVCVADLLAREPALVTATRTLEVVEGIVVPTATGDGQARVEEWVRQASDAAVAELLSLGVSVVNVAGWATRGRPSLFAPQGTVIHHTADQAYGGDYDILWLVRDGRSDLNGPLAQWGLGRRGTVYRIAIGTANHAGPGNHDGLAGNSSVWGIEAANDGVGEAWPDVQARNYRLLCAALARHTPHPTHRICSHRRWAAPAGTGKIDPTGIEDESFVADVEALLNEPVEDEMTPEDRATLTWAHDMLKKITAGFSDDDYQAAERLNEAVKAARDHGSKPHGGSLGGTFSVSGDLTLR